jgi:hypothetical protein
MGAGRLDRGAIPHACSVEVMLAWSRSDSRSPSYRSDARLPRGAGSSVTGASMGQRAAVVG